MRFSDAQKRVLARIVSGKLTAIDHNTREGRTVEALIRKGVVTYTDRVVTPSWRTYYGRTIPPVVTYIGLKA